MDILKLRYNLSDKALFHPQKCSADSMLISAVARNGLGEDKLLEFSDEALLHELRNDPLAKMIRKRDLFKPVFVCDLEQVYTFQNRPKEEVILDLHRNNNKLRTEIEKGVERELGLPEDQTSVLIFCPRPHMTLKPVLTLVQWKDGATRRLNEIKEQDDLLISRQIGVLQDIYPRLWKLYVFVRPDLRFRGRKIATTFQEVLKDKTGLTATCDPAFESYLDEGEYGAGRMLERELEDGEQFRKLERQERHKLEVRCWARSGGPNYRRFDERFVEAGKPVAHKPDDEWVKMMRQVVQEELSKINHESPSTAEPGRT